MKRFKNISLAFALSASVLVGCNKDYLETSPTTAVTEEVVFNSTSDAMKVVDGMYRLMYRQIHSQQSQGGIGGYMIYMDVMGDDLVLTAATPSWFRDEYKWIKHRDATSPMTVYHYLYPYSFIAQANLILDNIDKAEGPQSEKDNIIAQAKAIRAYFYFILVQLYGERYDESNAGNNTQLAVPLKVKYDHLEVLPRATVEQVYTQIVDDLEDAISKLTNDRRDKTQINKNVAQGFLARVYMAMGNYEDAADLAHDARQGFTLMSPTQYMSGFNSLANDEWMWGTRQLADQTTYFYNFFAYMSANYNSTHIRTNPKAINKNLYDLISATDVRKGLWDPTGTNTSFPIPDNPASERKPYMNRKFLVADESMSNGDYPLMRAAEMYLIEAEALARQGGKDAQAQQVLYDLVVTRDNAYTKSTNTGANLLDEILIQRRIELWGEGFRFTDLKRMNLPLDRTNSNHNASYAGNVLSVPAGDIRWQFLLPQNEINFSDGIVTQNPL